LERFNFTRGSIHLKVIHELPPTARLDAAADAGIIALANDDRYFDKDADDQHAEVGGSSSRLGYADCRLPLVLAHNTPNNSIFLLRGEYAHTFVGLFPRVSRHKRSG
jgi:hypothetical protein